jgi:hypothetical protein
MSVSWMMRATGTKERAVGAAAPTSEQTTWRTHAIVGAVALAVGIGVLIYTTDAASTEARLNDFYREALPAYLALTHGHLLAFL